MTKMNKIPYVLLLACALCAFGCTSNIDSTDYDKPTVPAPVPVQPGDNVVFSNQTEFAVKVYSDSTRSVLVADVAAKESISCHVDVASAGNVFYFSYFMDVNGVSVPYGVTDGYTVLLDDGSATTVKITDPQVVNTNKRIILLKNEAASAIVLYKGNKEERPEGKSASLVNGGDYGIYMLDARDDIETVAVVDGTKRVLLSTAADFENGYIYTVVYDGAKIYMRSKGFLDRNMSKKIWKIGVSQEAGKTLVITYLCRRKNGQGYMAVGKTGYSSPTINIESRPYFASIDSVGAVSDFVSEFRDKPVRSEFFDIAESDEVSLILGWNVYSDDKSNCFVMSDENSYSVYKSIVEDTDEYLYDPISIIHKVDTVFCVLIKAVGRTNSELCQYQLYEVSVDGYDKVSFKKIYESEDDGIGRIANEFIYDSVQDTYVVLFQEEKNGKNLELSAFSFIDATSGEKKREDLVLNNYLFNYMELMPETNYAYASGSYVNQITSKDVASFVKIDITSGSVANEKPVQYPAKSPTLNSNFSWFTFKDNEIVFAGYTDADYEQGGENIVYSDAYPLLVSYSLNDNSKLYEQIYDDMKGFVIETVGNSELDTLLLKLWNSDTNECYIVSTGFFGALPENEKLSLPYNVKTEMATPNLTIEFHKDYSLDDAYNETSFKYGTTITLADLESYADAPVGYSVVGWYDWINDVENIEVSFPFVITERMKLYPKIKISPPSGISGYALSDSEIYVEWDAHPASSSYWVYVNGSAYRSTDQNHCTISGLSPSTSYTISVIAYDNANEEWSERSEGCTVRTQATVVADNWSSVPSGAEEMAPDTGNRYKYLSRDDVHYYYAYFEAGKSYCVQWADRDNAGTITDLNGYDPIADVVVYTYYAGGNKGEKHDTSCLISFNCTRSGYYVMEVQGYDNSAEGYYAIKCYGKAESVYPDGGAGVYSYTVNIDDISAAWGGSSRSPTFSIVLLTDEQLANCMEEGSFYVAPQDTPEYQIAAYGNVRVADTSVNGLFKPYGQIAISDSYQYYTGVAVEIFGGALTVTVDMAALVKTDLLANYNYGQSFVTNANIVNLTGYKPYVLALADKTTDLYNYKMTVWNGDLMKMNSGATFPTGTLQENASAVSTCYDLAYYAGTMTAAATGTWVQRELSNDKTFEFVAGTGLSSMNPVDAFKFSVGSWDYSAGGVIITSLDTSFELLESSLSLSDIVFADGVLTEGETYEVTLRVVGPHEAYVKVSAK